MSSAGLMGQVQVAVHDLIRFGHVRWLVMIFGPSFNSSCCWRVVGTSLRAGVKDRNRSPHLLLLYI